MEPTSQPTINLSALSGSPIFCDSCHRKMSDDDGENALIGIALYLRGDTDEAKEHIARLYPELDQEHNYQICWVCWLHSLGVKI